MLHRLNSRLTIPITLMTVIIGGILNLFALSTINDTLQTRAIAEGRLISNQQRDTLTQLFRDISDDSQSLASNPIVYNESDPAHNEFVKTLMLSLIGRYRTRYSRICILSKDGQEILCVKRDTPPPGGTTAAAQIGLSSPTDLVDQANSADIQGLRTSSIVQSSTSLIGPETLRYSTLIDESSRTILSLTIDLQILGKTLANSVLLDKDGKPILPAVGATQTLPAATYLIGSSQLQSYTPFDYGKLHWVIVNQLSLANNAALNKQLITAQLLFGLLSIVLSIVISVLTVQQVTRPLRQLTQASQRLTITNTNPALMLSIPRPKIHEIGSLYDSLNKLLTRIEGSRTQALNLARITTQLAQIHDEQSLITLIAEQTNSRVRLLTFEAETIQVEGNAPNIPSINGQSISRRQYPITDLWIDKPNQLILIADIDTDPALTQNERKTLGEAGTRAIIAIPCHTTLGLQALMLSYDQPQRFNQDTDIFYNSLQGTLTAVLNTLHSQQQQQHQLTLMTQVAVVSAMLSSRLTQNELTERVTSITRDVFKTPTQLTIYQPPRPTDSTLDTTSDVLNATRSLPLVVDRSLLGNLDITQKNINPADLTALRTFASSVAVALDNLHLVEEANQKTIELQDAVQQTTEANAQLNAANRAKTDFMSTMSHELRTPLNVILGFSNILIRQIGKGTVKPEDLLSGLINIQEAGQRLLKQVQDLLDMDRIEAGHLILVEDQVQLKAQYSSWQRLAEGLPKRSDRIFVTEYDPALPEQVVLDAKRLDQIVLNLISNAFKFTNSADTVRLAIQRDTDSTWKIIVSDTGIGIAAHDLARIFEPFLQAESGADRAYQGTGLGLAITRRLVNLMNGTIILESELGKGSTFTITLPLKEA